VKERPAHKPQGEADTAMAMREDSTCLAMRAFMEFCAPPLSNIDDVGNDPQSLRKRRLAGGDAA
jgi:hypothetical protein